MFNWETEKANFKREKEKSQNFVPENKKWNLKKEFILFHFVLDFFFIMKKKPIHGLTHPTCQKYECYKCDVQINVQPFNKN